MKEIIASESIKQYFASLEQEVDKVYALAKKAREKNLDPEPRVDIPLAANVAQRVQALVSSVVPEIADSNMAERIEDHEKEYGPSDWRVALKIAEEVAAEKFCKFEKTAKAIETGIRTGLAYITQGVVTAPLEGFVEARLKKREDGQHYLALFFSGPIRSAGGTPQAITVLIADYLRIKKGIAPYDPTEEEIKRYCVEVNDYSTRVAKKQYLPNPEEVSFLIKHVPVEINGDPTEIFEVSQYKRLPRVETTRIRGGMCLVLTEGPALKSKKVWRNLKNWAADFELSDWKWLDEFTKLKDKIRSAQKTEKKEEKGVKPDFYYLSDMVAGRPVFGYPKRSGGFRLRYGRSRLTGDGSWAISPVTMIALYNYLATGTQLKVEHPGKGTALTACDSIEGPIVLLEDGSVLKLETEEQAREVKNKIKKFLFLGDILISHGDFVEQGFPLIPPGYCEEWWALELQKLKPSDDLKQLLENPIKTKVSAQEAVKLSEEYDVPLHPYWTHHWIEISPGELLKLKNNIKNLTLDVKPILEAIGCPHTVQQNKLILDTDLAFILNYLLKPDFKISNEENALQVLQNNLKIKIRDKSGTTIGARMGRPEKSKLRKMKGSPHVLFPVGNEGGRLRCFQSALEKGHITADWPSYLCTNCNNTTIYRMCEQCEKPTTLINTCPVCKKKSQEERCHGRNMQTYESRKEVAKKYFDAALKTLQLKEVPPLIKGVRGTSNKDHIPEHLAKGILRAKHNLYVNKDGTIRYDMTELGVTHFKAKEIGTPVEKLKELGYEKDIHGKLLENEEQILEIKPQDIVLPASPDSADELADDVFFRVSRFIDDELQNLYRLPPYYNLKSAKELVGHLVIGLAPHTSAGIVGRIIGFSKTQAIFAHPYWHDACRRDLDGEELAIILLMDGFLNFSRQYLPDSRGSRSMDAPLVLTTVLNPAEIDDEVYDVNTSWNYPLELYEAAMKYEYPYTIKVEQIKDRLNTPEQYEGFGYTHEVSDMNMGNSVSAYKSLPTMLEKLEIQLKLAKNIRAVDLDGVAALVIEKHFIRDIKGNLRKFTKQEFRCITCNEKYRRPPMTGVCKNCRGKLVFTIAEGTIKKYLEASIKLAQYCPEYIQQALEIVKRRIESIFGREATKQIELENFFK